MRTFTRQRNVESTQAVGFLVLLFLPLCFAAASPADPNAVAVLHFANKGGEQDWLRTGLSDLLITAFSRIPSVRVLERTRLDALEKEHHFKQLQQAEVVKRLARLERVGRVVVGTFEAKGQQLTLNAALVDANSGAVMSTATAQGSLERLGILVEKLARDLLRKIGTRISEEELAKLRLVPTYDFPALQWHARGRDHFAEGNYADALEAFWRAAQRDPQFTWALESLAQTYDVGGEPEHALLAYLRAIENVEDTADTLRLAFQTRRLLEKIADPQRQPPLDERLARKEFQVLERTLKNHPIATMTREEMWQRYGDVWRHTTNKLARLFYISPDTVEMLDHQRRFTQEKVTAEWMHHYARLLERFGKPQEAFVWSDRALHLQRFCLLPMNDMGLARHAVRWHTVGREVQPAPDYVVTIDPQNLEWSFPDDPAARERFRWYGGTGFPPQDIYGIVFLAPPGYYVLKGTIEAVLNDKPAGPFSVPLLRPLTAEGLKDWRQGRDWERESSVRRLEAMRQAFTLPPEQKEKRLRELREQEMRENTSMTQTYLAPPATPGMWVELPVAPKALSKDFRDIVPVPLRGWKFSFILTRSPTETALPAWMLNNNQRVVYMCGWDVTVDPPEAELRASGERVETRRSITGTSTSVTAPKGTPVHLELRSPDGRQKSFDLRAIGGGTFLLSTRNGWKLLPEPLRGQGFLMRDRTDNFWFVSVCTEPAQKRADLYLQKSRDLVTWSEPLSLPFNTAYTENSPRLVQ